MPPWHRRLLARAPSWLHRRLLRFEAAIQDQVEAFGRAVPLGARILDAGAGEGQHAGHFSHCRYVGVDLAIGDPDWDYGRLDVVADVQALPFASGSFAAALSVVVLEHAVEPAAVVAELFRVLEPRGRLLLIAPQEWGVHQAPFDYFRFTCFGLRWLFQRAGFQQVEIQPMGGFFTVLGRRLLDSVLFFGGGWRWLLLPLVALVAGPAGVLLPSLDCLDRDRHSTLGYVCVARKAV